MLYAAIAVAIILLIIGLRRMYVFPGYKDTLVITTGKRIRLKRHGGAFVIPLIQKAYEIDLHPFYVHADEAYSAADGDIRINWTAAIAIDDTNLWYILDNGYNAVVHETQDIVARCVREVTSWTKRDDIVMELRKFGEQIEKQASKELTNRGLLFAAIHFYTFSFKE